MNYRFNVKKLGNHWYVGINHDNPIDVSLPEKIERFLDVLDENKSEILTISLIESYSVIVEHTIVFNDADILKYLTTDEDINMRFYIDDFEFYISSDLYYLLESRFNTNFHKTIYTIEVLNRTM